MMNDEQKSATCPSLVHHSASIHHCVFSKKKRRIDEQKSANCLSFVYHSSFIIHHSLL